MSSPGGSRLWRAVLLAILLAFCTVLGLGYVRRPASTATIRGQTVAERNGCFNCHGPGGMKSYPNPGPQSGEIPQWDGGMWMMYVQKEDDIREWILYGKLKTKDKTTAPGSHTDHGSTSGPEQPHEDHSEHSHGLVSMPAFGDRIQGQDLEDLVAYYKAVAWYDPDITEKAKRGRLLASQKGCFACHGPSGRTGGLNPGAFKGYIPPWEGADFKELVQNDQELRSWIQDGGIDRFRTDPIARFFIDRQKIQMPAYRDHLKPEELDAIIDYIHFLNETNRK